MGTRIASSLAEDCFIEVMVREKREVDTTVVSKLAGLVCVKRGDGRLTRLRRSTGKFALAEMSIIYIGLGLTHKL